MAEVFSRRRARRTLVGVGTVIALAVVVGNVGTPSSGAVVCSAVGHVQWQRSVAQRGIRVTNPGIAIADADVTCGRTVSIVILASDGSGHTVELGWGDHTDGGNCATPGPERFDNVVHMFNTKTDSLGYHCWTYNNASSGVYHLAPGQNDSFTISDDNTDTVWLLFHNGTQFTTADTSYTNGSQYTNTTRDNASDTAAGHFNGVQFDNADGWHDWINTGCKSDNDSAYSTQLNSQTDVQVLQASGSC